MSPLVVLSLLACIDTEVLPEAEGPATGGLPELVLSPERLDFEATAADAVAERTLTLRNAGDGPLALQDLVRTGSTAFTVDPFEPLELRPGEEHTLTVRFTPLLAEEEGALWITSDDPGAEQLAVPLTGLGLIPVLEIEPEILDFGDQAEICLTTQPITLRSVGGAPLTVSGLAVSGAGFALAQPLQTPQTLAPEEELVVEVDFGLSTAASASGLLWVEHDALQGPDQAQLQGEVVPLQVSGDRWLQGPFGTLDILVYVDRSGSMSDDAAHFAEHVGVLTAALQDLDVSWQLAVVTRDDGCTNTGVLTADTPDLESVVLAGALGMGGAYTEMGFSVTRAALAAAAPGGCNEGLLRAGARTALVMISDEPEQSRGSWTTWLAELQGLSTELVIHAVAGSIPDGSYSDTSGAGYYEASQATGGEYLSIYDDWGAGLADVAATSFGTRDERFELSYTPDGLYVEVRVDGAVLTTGWTLDLETDELVFDAGRSPATGSTIEIDYSTGNSCEG